MLIKYFTKFKNRTAIIEPNLKKWSYDALIKKMKLFDKLIKDKSIVLIISSNTAISLISYLSLMSSNKKSLIILLDESINKIFLKKIISNYKPNYIFGPEKCFDNNKVSIIWKFKNYLLCNTNNKKITGLNFQNKLLLPTSGTTGSSKLVRLSKNNIMKNSLSIINNLKIKKNDTTITTMPMAYSYGLSIINTHLLKGAKIILNNENISQKKFWIYFKKYKINSFGGVPQFYEFLKRLDFQKFGLEYLKYVTQAGGKLENDIKKYFLKLSETHKFKFYSMYGQTEASPRISSFEINKYPNKIESVGKAIAGVKVKIINKSKILENKFYLGELEIRGENVSLGYSKSIKDLKFGDINKSKIKTGDIGYIDNDGFIFLKGRKKRISKIFGLRVDLDDIENLLKNYKIQANCTSDDKKIIIECNENSSENKIKKLIYKNYNINQNYLIINKIKKFKKVKTLKTIF